MACGGAPLTVTFYDAGQALAALVTLPDGRRVLVDAGESPSRPGCGQPCRDDLLQVGHHRSVRPEYAVISSGRPGEGTNRTYCHPRKSTIERLASFTLDSDGPAAVGFDQEVSCREGSDTNWDDIGADESIWMTARDGTVVLQTNGDGSFVRLR